MLPDKQKNYELALEHALACARGQDPDAFEKLGAQVLGDRRYALPVLDATMHVDLQEGSVTLADGGGVGLAWQIPVLHYLSAPAYGAEPASWLAFADFPHLRGYEPVYKGRVLGRLCGTAGRTEEGFIQACRRLNATPIDKGDLGFQFPVFPHISLIVSWYRADDEFPSDATILYPDNILTFLPLEDVIVLAECLVARLQGKRW